MRRPLDDCLTPTERARFDTLLENLAATFASEGRPGGDAAAAALRAAGSLPYRRRYSTSEPRRLLETACGHPDALPLSTSVLACRDLISWTNWSGEGLADEVSKRLHSAELVGPDGHIAHEAVRVGLLLSEPGVDYPISSHSGEESYLVISGTAEWSIGGLHYTPQPPGSFIFHPAWAPHGRRTEGEPFLGAWRWSGDLDLSSFRVQART